MLQAATSGKGNNHSYIIHSSRQPFPSTPLIPTCFIAVKYLQSNSKKYGSKIVFMSKLDFRILLLMATSFPSELIFSWSNIKMFLHHLSTLT